MDRVFGFVRTTPQVWLAAAGVVFVLMGQVFAEQFAMVGVVLVFGAAVWWYQSRPQPAVVQGPRSTTPASAEDRANRLDTALAHQIAGGWRIESRTSHNAVLVSGQRVNHVLHFLIAVLTCGLWIFVWIILALAGGERRRHLAVDQYGNIH